MFIFLHIMHLVFDVQGVGDGFLNLLKLIIGDLSLQGVQRYSLNFKPIIIIMTAKKKPKTKSANSAAGKTTSSSKQQSKTPTKKANSSTKQKIKTVGRPSKNNTKVSKSSGKREKDGEIKVGEIVSKNAQGVTKSHSPKKESKAFTLMMLEALSTKKESTKRKRPKQLLNLIKL